MFLFPPETIHHVIIAGIKIAFAIPIVGKLISKYCSVNSQCLEREVFGLKFKNPIGFAAGFDKDAEIYKNMSSLGFGFMEVGTITPKPQFGNPKPRIFRLPKDTALINRMGFPSKGLKHASNKLNSRDDKSFIIGGNLGKNSATENSKSAEDYLTSFRILYDSVDYFVVNVSCPNVVNLSKLQNMESIKEIVTGLTSFRRGQNEYRPILIKISPMLSFEEIDNMIEVVKDCDLDGIVAVNTTTSREGLVTSQDRIDEIQNGGLSGEPLTKRALEVVKYIHEKTDGKVVIIGVGGISTVEDALNMLNAGASLIQLYTGYIYQGPMFVRDICKAIIKDKIKKYRIGKHND